MFGSRGGAARAPRAYGDPSRKITNNNSCSRYLSHEQTTVRKPHHCAAGAGSTGQSKQRAGSGAENSTRDTEAMKERRPEGRPPRISAENHSLNLSLDC